MPLLEALQEWNDLHVAHSNWNSNWETTEKDHTTWGYASQPHPQTIPPPKNTRATRWKAGLLPNTSSEESHAIVGRAENRLKTGLKDWVHCLSCRQKQRQFYIKAFILEPNSVLSSFCKCCPVEKQYALAWDQQQSPTLLVTKHLLHQPPKSVWVLQMSEGIHMTQVKVSRTLKCKVLKKEGFKCPDITHTT